MPDGIVVIPMKAASGSDKTRSDAQATKQRVGEG